MPRGYQQIVVVSYFVSTSNHNSVPLRQLWRFVVSYFVSTSNHNSVPLRQLWRFVVSYFVSTSNHNRAFVCSRRRWLFLILFLHQTTTTVTLFPDIWRCFLFCFYIKPQLTLSKLPSVLVVSYFVSTSNHNKFP